MASQMLTKIKLKNNDVVYCKMIPSEVRQYLSKGVSMGSIEGYDSTALATAAEIIIGVHAIVIVYKDQVSAT